MKLEMDLKPKDIVLLKVLGCVLIAFVMIRFLIFPGIEKHMDLVVHIKNSRYLCLKTVIFHFNTS